MSKLKIYKIEEFSFKQIFSHHHEYTTEDILINRKKVTTARFTFGSLQLLRYKIYVHVTDMYEFVLLRREDRKIKSLRTCCFTTMNFDTNKSRFHKPSSVKMKNAIHTWSRRC